MEVQANNRMYVLIQLHMVTNGVLAFRHDVALHDKSGGLQIPGSYFDGALAGNHIVIRGDAESSPGTAPAGNKVQRLIGCVTYTV